jgi:anti-sigma factor RsiW
MTRLPRLHPSFDALSAHADRSDSRATSTRVGAHVSRCAACAATVAEIHALGEAARTEAMPRVPREVWAQIEAKLRRTDREVPREVVDAGRPGGETGGAVFRSGHQSPTTVASRARLGLGLLIASIGTLTAILLASASQRDLGAELPSRLTLAHRYVMPGSAVRMRYRPATALSDQQTVTVWAWYRRSGAPRSWSWQNELVRAGTLRRSSAQEFVGSIVLPADALFAGYGIGDSLGFFMDRLPGSQTTLATALAADGPGRPKFDAMVAFLDEPRWVAHGAQVGDVADQLARLYPARPETWILTYRLKPRNVVGDFVKLFESQERAYAGWHDRLKDRRDLSAETEALMAGVGSDLMDTTRADFWLQRLVHEHTTDPAAPSLWIDRYRDVPRDSIPAVLAAFEPIWRASMDGDVVSRAFALAERSGDAALLRRWEAREAETHPYWVPGLDKGLWLTDSTARRDLASWIRQQLAKESGDTLAAPTLAFNARMTTNFKLSRRHRLETQLAAMELLDGDVRGARVRLDSLASIPDRFGDCHSSSTLRWRAEAARRLGDLGTARDDLAYLATAQNWQIAVVGDSAPQLLGSAYTPESWARAKEVAAAQRRTCFAAYRAQTKGTTR